MIRNAKDLSPDQKMVIESLLGRRVLENEAISLRAFEPPIVSDQRRQEIADELKKYFTEADANRKPVSAADAEDIIAEAVRSSRPDCHRRARRTPEGAPKAYGATHPNASAQPDL